MRTWRGGPVPPALDQYLTWVATVVGIDKDEAVEDFHTNRLTIISNNIRRHSSEAFAELMAA